LGKKAIYGWTLSNVAVSERSVSSRSGRPGRTAVRLSVSALTSRIAVYVDPYVRWCGRGAQRWASLSTWTFFTIAKAHDWIQN